MTAETFISFVGLSFFGVLMGVIIPENSCKNTLKILLSLVIVAALINVISGSDVASLIDGAFSDGTYSVAEDTLYSSAGKVIEDLTADEVVRLTEEYTGNTPSYTRCYTQWTGSEFVLTGIVVKCVCDNPAGVRQYLAVKLNVDGALINVVNIKGL